MKKIFIFLVVAIMLTSLVGCTKTSTTIPVTYKTPPTTPVGTPVSFHVAKSDESRITSPNVSDTQLSALVSGNNTFAFNLYHTLQTKQIDAAGNMFFSPYSISTALAMTYAGAAGDTEKQMSSALDFTLPQAQLHAAFNELALQLASRGQNAKGTNGKSFSLNIAMRFGVSRITLSSRHF
jgi:serpin B